jgi:DNA-binding transcriptional LysR family regulator
LSDIQFRTLDLNLLRVFDALLEERSVTGAARRLGVTPSAISHSLNRLRYLLKDELFVRIGNSMRPSPTAADIGPRIHQALIQMRQAIRPSHFLPEESDRCFYVSATPYTSWVMAPAIAARLRSEAPATSLRLVAAGTMLGEYLDSGRTDIAITMMRHLPERFESELLLNEQLVWVMRSDNPAARHPLTLEALASVPHVLVGTNEPTESAHDPRVDPRMAMRDQTALEREFIAKGLRQTVGVVAPDALSALAVASRSDMATLIPARIARAFAPVYEISIFPPPYECVDVEFHLAWHHDHIADPARIWLRGVLREIAATL